MKAEMVRMLETAVHGFTSLQAEHSKLKEQINQAGHQHQTRVAQLLLCVQDQMNLLALDTRSDFKGLQEALDAHDACMEALKMTIL
ncbi:kinesin-like protein KIF11, partial [Tachysurus ichikawai]